MKKVLIATAVLATAAVSLAGPVPKEIKARYAALDKVMRKVDFAAFSAFFAPEFVSVDPKGREASRDEFLGSVKPLFESATKGMPTEKLISATKTGDVINVKFDFRYSLIGKKGTTKIHEVGVDSWKKIDGKWLFVKTVDSKFTVTMPKGK